jgi:hypothetical protein
MSKRISERQTELAIMTKPYPPPVTLIFAMMITVSIGCGCRSTAYDLSSRVPISALPNGLYLIRGSLATNWLEEPFRVATFTGEERSGASVLRIFVSVAFYEKTLRASIPTNALLVLRENPRVGLELLGRDAGRCILVDTKENREHLLRAAAKNQLLPKRNTWLPESEAISLGRFALGITDSNQYRFDAKRYEFGWQVSAVSTEKERPIGTDAQVVIDDNRAILAVKRGF